MRKILLFVIGTVFILTPLYAKTSDADARFNEFYKKASAAVAKEDFTGADFWVARCFGYIASDRETKKEYKDLIPLFEKMSDRLKPTAFISGFFDKSFLQFYFTAPWNMWAIPENNIKKDGYFFVQSNIDNDGKYVCVVKLKPELEHWIVMEGPNNKASMVVPLGAAGGEILAGKLNAAGNDVDYFEPVKLDKDLRVQYVWHVEFHDIDNDGKPEIWVRYNQAMGDGFTQKLCVYRIVDDKKLSLIKEFDGEAEGIARRLPDGTVQLGMGTSQKELTGHLGYDMTTLETWAYTDGKFVKTGDNLVKHILWSKGWTDYYFEKDK